MKKTTTRKRTTKEFIKKVLKSKVNVEIVLLTVFLTLLVSIIEKVKLNNLTIIGVELIIGGVLFFCNHSREELEKEMKEVELEWEVETLFSQEDDIGAIVEVVPVKFKAYDAYMQNKADDAIFYAKLYKRQKEVMIFIQEKESETLKVYDSCRIIDFQDYWKVET